MTVGHQRSAPSVRIADAAANSSAPSLHQAAHFSAVAAIFLWSAGNLMVRDLNMPGLQIAFWRLLIGSAIYGSALYLSGRRIHRRSVRVVALPAVAIALEIAAFFVAIKITTVANTTVIGALAPLVLLGVAVRKFGERVPLPGLIAAVVGLVGVAVVVYGSSAQPTWSPGGDLLAVIAMLFFAAYLASGKRARQTVPVFEMQTLSMMIGAVTLAPLAAWQARGIDVPEPRQFIWLVGLLFVPGTGHLAMNWAHSRVALWLSSMLTLGIPVLSSLGAAWLLNEPLGTVQLAGMAVVISALAVVIRVDSKQRKTMA